MNAHINLYFDSIEARLLSSPVILNYQILRREVSPAQGILRIKVTLNDSGAGEFFEYVIESNSKISIAKYSFHWQDKAGVLIKRWDNAPHHKEFSERHHLHLAGGAVTQVTVPPNTLDVITEIEHFVEK